MNVERSEIRRAGSECLITYAKATVIKNALSADSDSSRNGEGGNVLRHQGFGG
jgi:hypothetical protein